MARVKSTKPEEIAAAIAEVNARATDGQSANTASGNGTPLLFEIRDAINAEFERSGPESPVDLVISPADRARRSSPAHGGAEG
jgi:hypothetical protein